MGAGDYAERFLVPHVVALETLARRFAPGSVVLLIRNKRGHCIVSPLMAGAGSKGT